MSGVYLSNHFNHDRVFGYQFFRAHNPLSDHTLGSRDIYVERTLVQSIRIGDRTMVELSGPKLVDRSRTSQGSWTFDAQNAVQHWVPADQLYGSPDLNAKGAKVWWYPQCSSWDGVRTRLSRSDSKPRYKSVPVFPAS